MAKLSNAELTGQVDSHLTDHQQHRVHHLVKPDFIGLQQAAKQAGFTLTLASSFRDFSRQQMIWNNKFNGVRPILDSNSQPLDPDTLTEIEKIDAIMRWSALPGTSRHHWGTDLDVYASNCLPEKIRLQLEPWEYLTGHQAEFNQWLTEHLAKFGFYRPYAKDNQGVAEEPWHISYHSVSKHLLEQLTPELIQHTLQQSEVAGKTVVIDNLDRLYKRFIANISSIK